MGSSAHPLSEAFEEGLQKGDGPHKYLGTLSGDLVFQDLLSLGPRQQAKELASSSHLHPPFLSFVWTWWGSSGSVQQLSGSC